MFAGVAPGLKSDAQGGIMPFAGVITPIDGLGPLGELFSPIKCVQNPFSVLRIKCAHLSHCDLKRQPLSTKL